MTKRKQKEVEQKMINLMEGKPLNTRNDDFEVRDGNVVKVSDMIDTLSRFNPDADVHNIGDGRYTVTSPSGLVTDVDIHDPNVPSTLFDKAMNSALEDEDQCYGCDGCDSGMSPEKYGDRTPKVMNLASMYNSGDFTHDMTDMDTDFAAFMINLQAQTSNIINDRIDDMKQIIEEDIVNISKSMIDNMVSYQNTKNARAEMELAVRRVK